MHVQRTCFHNFGKTPRGCRNSERNYCKTIKFSFLSKTKVRPWRFVHADMMAEEISTVAPATQPSKRDRPSWWRLSILNFAAWRNWLRCRASKISLFFLVREWMATPRAITQIKSVSGTSSRITKRVLVWIVSATNSACSIVDEWLDSLQKKLLGNPGDGRYQPNRGCNLN